MDDLPVAELAEGPVVAVQPFITPDGSVGVPTDDGGLHLADANGWKLTVRLPGTCWSGIGASSGRGVYLDHCDTCQLHGSEAQMILGSGAYGAVPNGYASGFLATPNGQPVTLADADTSGRATERAVVGVYRASD